MSTAADAETSGPARPRPWPSSRETWTLSGSKSGRNPFLESRAKERDAVRIAERYLWGRSPDPSSDEASEDSKQDRERLRRRSQGTSNSDDERRRERKRLKKLEKRTKKEEKRRKR